MARRYLLLLAILALAGCPFDQYFSTPKQNVAAPHPQPMQPDKTAEQLATLKSQIQVLLALHMEDENRIAALEKAKDEPPKDRTTIMWRIASAHTPGLFTMAPIPQPLSSFTSNEECLASANKFVAAQTTPTPDFMSYLTTSPDGNTQYVTEFRCLPIGVDPRSHSR